MSDLTKVTSPKELAEAERLAIFEHVFRRLAAHRNTAELYAVAEYTFSTKAQEQKNETKELFLKELNGWGQGLLQHVWLACQEPGGGPVPELSPYSDTSLAGLPPLPDKTSVKKVLSTVLLLHITSRKDYSARTRAFLFSFTAPDEAAVAGTLKDPTRALEEAERKTKGAKEEASEQSKTLRRIGIGLGAVAGGVLVGVTGGLAAPLVGAGVSTALGWFGVGGTAAGLLATGLASSSVVCGALFGYYGSRKMADTVGAYLREVHDLAIMPVRKPRDTLAVRLCISGWLDSQSDVVAPWTVFDGDDTFALQWEVQALRDLSNALTALIKSQTMKYVRAEIIKRTVFASLWAALSPTVWLNFTRIIASKTGKVLGKLLEQRVLGNRPISLVGYSLGSLVIFEALQYLASLPPTRTFHLVQDVYLFGAPVSTDEAQWTAMRRVVAGRLVNGYGANDYVLAVLTRLSDVTWNVAGMGPVPIQGVQNVECNEVDGHLKWRSMVGESLSKCKAPGIVDKEVAKQVGLEIGIDMDMDEREADRIVEQGRGQASDAEKL
ncbi:DUF726-domain-containing protein [Daedalea quercina L-15889]|uniref:DUF726-domain-containing protein n=1 Tax=Daedalea quercina L-15889 TaxID=1314783 RepID=A0A165PEW5_9APHY|nr:DUF726-domain-containing protein [Daedalea quercina L-15889]